MKNSEIKELTDKEIIEKITDEKSNLVRMRINHKVSDLDNPQKISELKKLIARLKTEKRAREINSNKAE